jgi:hypothetical protein
MLERAGRESIDPDIIAELPLDSSPAAFSDATWGAIAKRYRSSNQWNPAWGPGPDRIDCMMPDKFL